MADLFSGSVLQLVQVVRANTLVTGVRAGDINAVLPNGQTPTTLANGTSAGQVDKGYVVYATAAISTADNYDLTALTTGQGNPPTSKMKLFAVVNLEAADSGKDITFAGGASNPWLGPLGGTTPTRLIKAGTAMVFVDLSTAGMAISGSLKLFKLTPGATTVSYAILMLGN
jgi:hypothetical protein